MENPALDILKCKSCSFVLSDEKEFLGDHGGMWFYSRINDHIISGNRQSEDSCIVSLVHCSKCGEQIGQKYDTCTSQLAELENAYGIRYSKATGKQTLQEKVILLRNLYAQTRDVFVDQEARLSNCEQDIEKMLRLFQVINSKIK